MSQTYSICALVEIFVFTTSYYLLSSTAHGLSQILFKQECTVFVTYFGHAWKQLKPGSIFMVTEGPRAPKEAPDHRQCARMHQKLAPIGAGTVAKRCIF